MGSECVEEGVLPPNELSHALPNRHGERKAGRLPLPGRKLLVIALPCHQGEHRAGQLFGHALARGQVKVVVILLCLT